VDDADVTRAWLEERPVLWRNVLVRITAGGCVCARIIPVDPAAAWPDARKSRDRWVEIAELHEAPPGTVIPKPAPDRPARQLSLLEAE
jgi:hypothetical protein